MRKGVWSGVDQSELEGAELMLDYTDGHTSWHNVFSFNENQHGTLKRLGKG